MVSMNQKAKVTKYLVIAMVTLVLFSFINASFNQLRAALHYYKANNLLTQWRESEKINSQGDYILAKETAQKAVELSNNNPLYLDVLADIYQWGLYQKLESDPVNVTKKAMQLYKLSIQNRPSWPVTWANMAVLKWRNGEFDENFKFYLSQADKFGKSQPEVHLLFTELGLAAYQARHPLYTQYKQTIKHRIYNAILSPKSRDKALSLIEKYEQRRIICRWLTKENNGYVLRLAKC
ncbi:VpsP family polysaccharide biosynthesis protein [Alteromonas macleodii]|jgi:tetratricopeptide (TPR) repeat protein|uniref:VpsP family polysaccharide biosynthesis protein n=1 Tax=Alteromonas macleodii TaxID=28108 RepID=UPI003661C1A5